MMETLIEKKNEPLLRTKQNNPCYRFYIKDSIILSQKDNSKCPPSLWLPFEERKSSCFVSCDVTIPDKTIGS